MALYARERGMSIRSCQSAHVDISMQWDGVRQQMLRMNVIFAPKVLMATASSDGGAKIGDTNVE